MNDVKKVKFCRVLELFIVFKLFDVDDIFCIVINNFEF